MALSQAGRVWAWGVNKFGRLGDGTAIDRLTPIEVKVTDEVIKCVACGRLNNLFLTVGGTVFLTGMNIPRPKRIEIKPGTNIVKIAVIDQCRYDLDCMEDLLLCYTQAGDSFVWSGAQADTLKIPSTHSYSLADSILEHAKYKMSHAMLSTVAELDSDDADIEFVFPSESGQSIRAHRHLLSMSSEYFKNQLCSNWCNQYRIEITESRHAVYRLYLLWIYTDQIECTDFETLLEVYDLASRCREDKLKSSCFALLPLVDITNCVRLYEFAVQNLIEEFEENVARFVTLNFFDVVKTNEFSQMKSDNMGRLFAKFSDNCSPKFDQFQALFDQI